MGNSDMATDDEETIEPIDEETVEPIDETPSIEDPPGEWLNPREYRKKYGVPLAELRKLGETKKVRTRGSGSSTRYAENDVLRETGELPAPADDIASVTVRQANVLAKQAQDQMVRLFDMAFTRADSLLGRQQAALDKANEHILKLEEDSRKNREAMESIRTEDHLREIATRESKHREAITEQAWEVLKKLGLPIFAKKFGIAVEEKAAPTNGAPPKPTVTGLSTEDKAGLADMFLLWAKGLTEEQFQSLKPLIPEEQYDMLSSLRTMIS